MRPRHLLLLPLLASAALVLPLRAADASGPNGGPGKLPGPERKPEPKFKPADQNPQKALAKLGVPEGFKTDLWAAEPLLANPVAFCIDDKGRIYTSETNRHRTSVLDIRNYMFMLEDDLACRTVEDRVTMVKKYFPNDWQKLGIETEVIRLLKDTNNDGKADESSVYADGFNTVLDGIASGVMAHDGKVWFTNMPDLWLLEGETADGKSVSRKSLSHGYGVRFNYTGHDMHGLIIGPDGRLYFSFGDRAAHVKTMEGGVIDCPDMGAVFRCEPDGTHMEMVMKGLRNPQELAFDDHGNLWTGDNDSDQGDHERWVLVCDGADAGWRIGWQHNPMGKELNPWLTEGLWKPREKDTPAWLLSPISNIPDGPSGLLHYPGTGLPESYNGHFFLCSFKGSSGGSNINSWTVEPNGAGFKLIDQKVFVKSVQATDVDIGPDSKIYFSDWGEGWDYNGQGRIMRTWNPEALAKQAPQVAEVQKLLGEGFRQRGSVELGKLLGYPDQRIRLRAQWALVEKPDAANILTIAATKETKPLARLHGLWGLNHLARLQRNAGKAEEAAKTLAPVAALLTDADPEIRSWAAKVAGEAGLKATGPALVKLLGDSSARVSYFAAEALGSLGDTSVAPKLVEFLRANADKDEYVRHAGITALEKLKATDAVKAAATDSSTAVRRAALLVLRRWQSPEVAAFLKDSDASLVKEAVIAIAEAPIPAAYPAVAALLAGEVKDGVMGARLLNSAFRAGRPEDAKALAAHAVRKDVSPRLRREALDLLAQWEKPFRRDRVVGILRPLPDRDAAPAVAALTAAAPELLRLTDDEAFNAVLKAFTTLKVKTAGPALASFVADANGSAKLRSKALGALADLGAPELNDALAAAQKDPALSAEAGNILAKRDPAHAAGDLIKRFPGASLSDKRGILETLAKVPGEAVDKFLADHVKNIAKVAPEIRLEVLEAAGQRESKNVKAALAAREAALPKDDPLAAYTEALDGGDATRGAKLFKEHAVAACLRCHKVNGEGSEVGPDLSKLAATKDRHYILESIVTPNARIAEGFQMAVLSLNDGSTKAGMVKSENAEAVTLQNPGAPAETVKKADIKSRDNVPSGMLPNLGVLLSRRDLRDIIEFCATLK